MFDESESQATKKAAFEFVNDHDCYLLRRLSRPKNEGHMLKER